MKARYLKTALSGLWLLAFLPAFSITQDSLRFSGQASVWALYGFDQDMPLRGGARYIPQLNFGKSAGRGLLDAEFSINISGSAALRPFDSLTTRGSIRQYRLWLRYSQPQFELRIGLQKINFGSAGMLRPLMWFDQIDPRDPLQLTDGVWGLLGRYYFLNNANLWGWVLYPSKDPKTWEFAGSNRKTPELGGRVQMTVPRGEAGITFHWRKADTRLNILQLPEYGAVPESRTGLDAKWDIGPGLWFEATHTTFGKKMGIFSNQSLLSAGIDYTFGLGNGLYAMAETLAASMGNTMLSGEQSVMFTGLSVSYPISISGSVNAIVYRDWKGKQFYTFANYRHRLRRFDLHLMAYINPEQYYLPAQRSESRLFAGKGIQIMLVYNH